MKFPVRSLTGPFWEEVGVRGPKFVVESLLSGCHKVKGGGDKRGCNSLQTQTNARKYIGRTSQLSGIAVDFSGGCDGFCDGFFRPRGTDFATDFVADFLSCVFLWRETDFVTDFETL